MDADPCQVFHQEKSNFETYSQLYYLKIINLLSTTNSPDFPLFPQNPAADLFSKCAHMLSA